MATEPNDVRWVEEPKVGLWEASFLPAVLDGLKTTVRHVFARDTATQQFPEVKPGLPANYRGLHRLNRDEQGRVKCVACFMCATACPAHCISIEASAAPPEWPDRDKFPASFEIDELKCIFCGMCEEACPVDAIELTGMYDVSGLTRADLVFDREKLLSMFDETAGGPADPVRTHRGVLGPASELERPPINPPTKAVGAPAIDGTPRIDTAAPAETSSARLFPPGPIPGAPTHMHPVVKGRG